MSKADGKYLTGKLKDMIVQEFACFESAVSIQRRAKEEFGRDIPISTLYSFAGRHSDLIITQRDLLSTQLQKIPVASLYWRLKKRQDLIDDIEKNGLWYTDKQGIRRGNHGKINELLNSAMTEFKQVEEIQVDNTVINILSTTEKDFLGMLKKKFPDDRVIENGK